MFNNIGNKIKTLVTVVFVIGCIGAGIVTIVTWSSIPSVSEVNAGAGVLTFFGGLLAGGLIFLFSWIGSFFLYGYGELIDCCQNMSYDIEQIKAQVIANKPAPFLHGKEYDNSGFDTGNYKTSTTSTGAGKTSNFRAQTLNIWTCKNCGSENSGDSIFCSSCGERK